MHSYSRIFPSRRGLVSASFTVGLLLAVQQASAANLNWDPGLTPATASGGTGTWNTTNFNWSDGTTDIAWPNTNTNSATFGGTAGTVTLGAALTTGGLSFTTSGYTISGAQNINLSNLANDTSTVFTGIATTTIDIRKLTLTANQTLANTDLVNFGSTLVTTGGNRTATLSMSAANATTTWTNFSIRDSINSSTPSQTISVTQGNLTITNLAAGVFNNAMAAYNTTTAQTITFTGATTGTTTLSGNNTLLNNAGTGTTGVVFNQTNGTLALGHDNALGAYSDTNNTVLTDSILTLQAGTVAASGGARTIANVVTVSGNAAVGGSNNFTLSGNVTVNATRTLTISNTAVTTLSGTNTNNGTIAVNSGSTLLVNGTTTGGAYTIASGATFGGTGTIDLSAINGSVTIGNGSFLQASSADSLVFNLGSGVLNVSVALANASPSMFFTLGAPGSAVVGATSTNIGSGVLEFGDFSFTAGTGFNAGTYTLFTSVVGTMGSNLTGTVGGLNATISQTGNDIILTTVSAVPEPSTFAALAGVGAIGAALLRRRRQL